MKGPSLPNVLIVGPPKCGTTSLFKWLSSHPDVCGSRIKETYFLMDEGHVFTPSYLPTLHANGIGRFEEYFDQHAGERIILESTPHHFNQLTALAYATEQRARAIFILRRPEERIYSQFQFNRHALAEFKGLSFRDFVNILMGDASADALSTSPRINYVLSTAIEASTYHLHVKKWVDGLGSGKVYIQLFEDLVDDPNGALMRLSEWLGIDTQFFREQDLKALNRTFRPRFPKVHTVLRRLGGHDPMAIETLKTWFSPFHFVRPKPIRDALDSIYFKMQIRPVPCPEEDQEAKLRLATHFERANRDLNNLGVDLSAWQ